MQAVTETKSKAKKGAPKKEKASKGKKSKEKKAKVENFFDEADDSNLSGLEDPEVQKTHEEFQESEHENPEEEMRHPLESLFSGSKRSTADFDETDDEDNALEETGDDGQELQGGLEHKPERDVFVVAQAMARKVADVAKFKIKRNGEFICTKTGTYSWDRLQKEYGGGQYNITSYRSSGLGPSNGYLISQTMIIADLPDKEESEDVPHKQSADTVAMLEMMKDLLSKNQTSDVEKIRATSEAKLGESSIMIQMMNQMNTQNMQMMMQMQKSSDEKMMLMMEMMKQGSNKKEEFGMKDILTLVTNAKDSGAKEMKGFYTMARELADEMADRGDGKEERKSPVDSIIESLPALATAFANRSQQPQPAPQALIPARQPVRPVSSGPAGATVAGRPMIQQSPQGDTMGKSTHQPLVNNHQTKKAQEAKVVDVKIDEPAVAASVPQAGGGVGKMKVDLSEEVDFENDDSERIVTPKLNPGESYQPDLNEGDIIDMSVDYEVQGRIIDLIQDDLINGFMTGKKADLVAKSVLLTLENNGIGSDQVLKAFPNEATILNIAALKNVPAMFQGKIKEFYAALQIALRESANTTRLKPGLAAQ